MWGFNQYGVFETFLEDLKEGRRLEEDLPEEVKKIIKREATKNPLIDEATRKNLMAVLGNIQKSGPSMNIGFLYSYKPSYYIGNDREEISLSYRWTTKVYYSRAFAILLCFKRKPQIGLFTIT